MSSETGIENEEAPPPRWLERLAIIAGGIALAFLFLLFMGACVIINVLETT